MTNEQHFVLVPGRVPAPAVRSSNAGWPTRFIATRKPSAIPEGFSILLLPPFVFVFSPVTRLRFRAACFTRSKSLCQKTALRLLLNPPPGSRGEPRPPEALMKSGCLFARLDSCVCACQCCARACWTGPASAAAPAVRQRGLGFQCLSGWIVV